MYFYNHVKKLILFPFLEEETEYIKIIFVEFSTFTVIYILSTPSPSRLKVLFPLYQPVCLNLKATSKRSEGRKEVTFYFPT